MQGGLTDDAFGRAGVRFRIALCGYKRVYERKLTGFQLALIFLNFLLFSSPELKAQVSYSDRLLSVVRLSVCL
jgi:hypothetical protein